MTERDVFETRFHAAVHGYVGHVSSDLDPAELAHRIAGARPRRSGLAARLAMPDVAIPRLVWALLLLAGLLAATIGGMLVAGSRPDPGLPAVVPPLLPAFTCPAGSNPDAPGPIGQARPPQTFTAAMAFDRRAGRIVMLAGTPNTDIPQTWTFDVCTNTWHRMGDAPAELGPGGLVYDARSDLTITSGRRRGGGSDTVWTYDLTSDTWTEKGRPPFAALPRGSPRLVYDPVSGHIIRIWGLDVQTSKAVAGAPDLWTYDVDTDTWAATSTGGFSNNVLVAYDASVDRLIVYDIGANYNPTTRLFDPRNGTWEAPAGTSPVVNVGYFATGNEITYDETAHRTIVYSDGLMIAYDATAGRWSTVLENGSVDLCGGPHCRMAATIVYDPVNERLILYGGEYRDPSRMLGSQSPGASTETASPETIWVQDDSVLAFDLATRTWSVLLEATRVQTPPG